jgi:hypothetical protein
MTHSIHSLATAPGLDSFFGSAASPNSVVVTALALVALFAMVRSADNVTRADLPLPSLVAAVASFAFLLMVLAGASWPS